MKQQYIGAQPIIHTILLNYLSEFYKLLAYYFINYFLKDTWSQMLHSCNGSMMRNHTCAILFKMPVSVLVTLSLLLPAAIPQTFMHFKIHFKIPLFSSYVVSCFENTGFRKHQTHLKASLLLFLLKVEYLINVTLSSCVIAKYQESNLSVVM